MNRIARWSLLALLATPIALPALAMDTPLPETDRTVKAQFTADPIAVDGKLDEAAWANAPVHEMQLPLQAYDRLPESMRKTLGTTLREGGKVRLLWNDQFLFIGAEFVDSDAMNDGKEDQGHFYQTGDLLEVFLKPASANYYWELYGTPHNKKSWFFLISRGRPLRADYLPKAFAAAATVDGTFDNWKDRDAGWTVEIAVPIKELTAHGAEFGPAAAWTILLARYNYSAHLPKDEWSTFPRLSAPNFHLYEEYAQLRLIK